MGWGQLWVVGGCWTRVSGKERPKKNTSKTLYQKKILTLSWYETPPLCDVLPFEIYNENIFISYI